MPSAPGSNSARWRNRCGPRSPGGPLRRRSSTCWRCWARTRASPACGIRSIRTPRPVDNLHPRRCGLIYVYMAGRDVHYLAAHTRMGYPKSGRNHARPAQRFSSRPHVYTRTARCQIEGSTMDAKTDAKKKTGTITVGNKNWDFPVYDGTIGPEVLDIAKLYNESGMFTYDPGFTSTASCESKITYIDGDLGVLLYRGYPIDQLAEHGDFLETCYLLLYGELPTPQQKHDFDYRVTRHTMVHEQMARFFQGFRRDAHPMAVMTGCIGALSAFYHDSTDISDPHQRMIASLR